ncbi:efflux RND transporter permease subunit [Halovenus marina]|uniref:efflux RND transporter permease subunit n=1 Tax=Halovenus marina TaxID=3396621 RepID=UPI003F55EEDB
MSLGERLAGLVTNRSKTVIAVLLVLTLLVGAGGAHVEESQQMDMFDEDPPEVTAQQTIQQQFTGSEANTTHLNVVVRNESGNVLDRDSLLASLRYQQALRTNATVNQTLLPNGLVGIENVVATAAIQSERNSTGNSSAASPFGGAFDPASAPPLAAQIDQLESMSDAQVQRLVADLLAEGSSNGRIYDLLPSGYQPASTDAESRLLLVTQKTDGQVLSPPELSERVRTAQVTAADIAEEVDEDEYLLVGDGLMVVEEGESTNDSLALVGPVALLFVLVTLSVAYRDLLDLLLGLVGIVLVLVWTFGAMGWLGIDFNTLMIATPVLLIGLSIDYCIHVVMRYREQRAETDGEQPFAKTAREAMHEGLAGLGPALLLVTVTAMIGFLSILTSGVPTLGEFGIATAAGIAASLVVFGALVPALKVELASLLASRDRTSRAFGTTGRVRGLLAGIARVSYRRPRTILLVALVVSSLGVAAGTQLDSDFASDDYIAEEPPDWTQDLPEPFAPGEYDVRQSIDYLFSNFQSPDQQVHYLVESDGIDPATLERVAAIERAAANTSVTFTRPTGDSAVRGPVSLMQRVAATNETFAAQLATADTTGDGVPDRNVTAVLDSLVDAAPDRAERFLHRTESGRYDSLQVVLVVDGTAGPTAVADEARAVVDQTEEVGIDESDDEAANAAEITVTGDLVVNELVQRQLSTTLVTGLVAALAAVLAVLLVAFRYTNGSASLGAVTLAPVLLGLSWILGVMYLLDIPFSFATATIGSIAIGLGVDYAIHMSERYRYELDRLGDVPAALEASVVGTGGALLGSAVTTAGGFGVLAFSLVPVMQQFGLVIAVAISFAFLASVLVLPSLLVVWTRSVHDSGRIDSTE